MRDTYSLLHSTIEILSRDTSNISNRLPIHVLIFLLVFFDFVFAFSALTLLVGLRKEKNE